MKTVLPASPIQSTFVAPQVKYPGAIIFEGGTGHHSSNLEAHSPRWRLYICLQQTTAPISGQIAIDFTQLDFPIELSSMEINSLQELSKVLYTRQLKSVFLKYNFTSEVIRNLGFTSGELKFQSTSIQNWELISHAPNYFPDSSEINDPKKDLFSLNIDQETIYSFSNTEYVLANETFYVSSWFEKFTFDQTNGASHVITVCEQADKSIVWQTNPNIQ